jgi:alpha-D-xyloside xylohydrolase
LPEGTDWYDFWTNDVHTGGEWLDVDAGIGRIPLFVKAGAIIPMKEPAGYADANPVAPVTVRVYPGRSSTFMLYDDSGDGYAYEQGEYKLVKLSWDNGNGKLTYETTHEHPNFETKYQLITEII